MHGRSQAVRLPKEFRLPGKEVSVRRQGRALIIEPLDRSWAEIFAELDRMPDPGGFEEGWRQQPPMPPDKKIDFE
jgi:antitoxin VapB